MTIDAILPRERVDSMMRSGLWPDLTLLQCLEQACRRAPSATAVIDHNSTTGHRTTLNYRQLDECSRRIAAGLRRLGVARGEVVSFQLPNWWQFTALHLACLRIGAVSNPLMPIFRQRELEFMLGLAEARVLIVPAVFRGFDHEAMAHTLQARLRRLQHVLAIGGCGPDSFEARLLAGNLDPEAMLADARPMTPNDVVQILYTSGTTGEPKGVMHTSNTLFSNLVQYARRLQLSESDVVLMASPLAHQTGFMYGMMLPIYLGCASVLQDVWNAETATDIIEHERITYTFASTPFLSDMAEVAAQRPAAFNSLRTFHSAGATIPGSLVRSATERMGARIISGWGMTENGAATSTKPDDPPEKTFESDGCAMEGMALRVVDAEGRPLAIGQSGHLQVRGCSNFVGYLKRPQLYQTDAEGWFVTGDIARLDADGYLRITGRSKDVVIRGGENVPVVEIENLLIRHPKIREVAVVGRPDARLGERASAWVVVRPGEMLELTDITRYLAECGVSKTYFPEFLRLCNELPKTPSGKVQKFQLREMEKEKGEDPGPARGPAA